MADPSFDVVSKVDRQEVDNALNQAARSSRSASTSAAPAPRSPGPARRRSPSRPRPRSARKAAVEVFKEKLIKRNISLKAFDAGEPAISGKTYKVSGKILQGIESDKAKEITKAIRDEAPKGVQAQIQGDQLRVSGKKKDDLQAVIALLKGRDFGIALQFTNYR